MNDIIKLREETDDIMKLREGFANEIDERDLYNKYYEMFFKLINDQQDKVIMPLEHFNILEKKREVILENGIRYCDCYNDNLKHLCQSYLIVQKFNTEDNNYIFYKQTKKHYEWEDIETLGMVYTGNNEDEIMRNRCIINKLIENQKYLKEKLESKE